MQCCHARSTTPSPVDVAVPQTHRKPKATISVSSGCFQHGEVCARATLRGSLSACLPVCLLKKLRRGVEVWLGTEEVIRCQDNTQAPGPARKRQEPFESCFQPPARSLSLLGLFTQVPFSAALDVDCSTARLLTITACLLNHFFQQLGFSWRFACAA